jgi:hypothetical protein
MTEKSNECQAVAREDQYLYDPLLLLLDLTSFLSWIILSRIEAIRRLVASSPCWSSRSLLNA